MVFPNSNSEFVSECAVIMKKTLVLLGCLFLGACAGKAPDSGLQLQKYAQLANQEREDYLVGPDDLLDISVFGAKELKQEARVNSRGFITYPLIDAVKVEGLTPQGVEALLAKKLEECCLRNPQVVVFVKEFVSQRVIVQGYVKKSGSYPIKGSITLLHALALAEGVSELADLNDVVLYHGDNRVVEREGTKYKVYDVEAIMEGKVEDPPIRGNDIVVVSKSYAKEFLAYLQGLFRIGASVPLF